MVEGVTHAHLGPIWYHSEPSDIPYFPNQFLCWDFFAASYRKMALSPLIHSLWKTPNLDFQLKTPILKDICETYLAGA